MHFDAQATFIAQKLLNVLLHVCSCFFKNLVTSAALCPAITIFLTKVFKTKLSLPGSLLKSILLFWLFMKRYKKKINLFNICHTCPSSLNCGIQEVLNRHCTPLSKNASESQQPHNAPITASTLTSSAACVSRLENIRWACNCNQNCLNSNKCANQSFCCSLFKTCNHQFPTSQSLGEI